MSNLLATIRQWRYPQEFRIKPALWPPDVKQALRGVILRSATTEATATPPSAEASYLRILVDVATGLWRLQQKILQPGTDRPREEMRRAYRSFESTWDALVQAGVEILDHTDTPFSPGLSLKVIAFQPTPGIKRERVIETLRPTIYYKQQLLQIGEVIVGVPEVQEVQVITEPPAPPDEQIEELPSQPPEELEPENGQIEKQEEQIEQVAQSSEALKQPSTIAQQATESVTSAQAIDGKVSQKQPLAKLTRKDKRKAKR